MLQIPPQLVTWILRDAYIDGAEYTMNGKRMRLEKVIVPEERSTPAGEENEDDEAISPKESRNAKVISLSDLKSEKKSPKG
jgi:hypothetical protein